jgi:hypothetical protein
MDNLRSPYLTDSNETIANDEQKNIGNERYSVGDERYTVGEPPRYSLLSNTYNYAKKHQHYIWAILISVIIMIIIYHAMGLDKQSSFVNNFLGSQKEYSLNDRINKLNEMQNRNLHYLSSR